MVRFYGLAVESGVIVASLVAGGPADQARVHEGDVIVGADGEAVSGTDDLHRLLSESRIGRRVPMTVIRGAGQLTREVTPRDAEPRP